MRILLMYPYCIAPRHHQEDAGIIPIGVYYIAALLLENGFSVKVLNLSGFKDRLDEIRRVIREEQPDLVGFSIVNANRWGAVDISRMIKEIRPGAKVVCGGVGATFLWNHLLKNFPSFDYMIAGEGETAFLRLCQVLADGDQDAAAAIPGLASRRNGEPVLNPPGPPLTDLDALPDPARYFRFQHTVLSRGCPSDCHFCGSPKFWGRKVRFHSAAYILRQFTRLKANGTNFLYISDDTFTLNRRLVLDVCRGMIAAGLDLTWAAISRVDRVDAELLGWMRRAGCIQISYGIESGSERIRAFYNKHITRKQIRSAFSLTAAAGMMARAYFIYGAPGEEDADIDATIEMMKEIKPLGAIFYLLDVFPGTRIYEKFCRRFGVTDDIWKKRIEDIAWVEYEPGKIRDTALERGRKLRDFFHRRLAGWAMETEVRYGNQEERLLAADFYSRLAMTFSHGEYADGRVPDAAAAAEALYRRSLDLAPDRRAFRGLGMLKYGGGRWAEAEKLFSDGLVHFPDDRETAVCLAISYMNRREYGDAEKILSAFPDSLQILSYREKCAALSGEGEKAEELRQRMAKLPENRKISG